MRAGSALARAVLLATLCVAAMSGAIRLAAALHPLQIAFFFG